MKKKVTLVIIMLGLILISGMGQAENEQIGRIVAVNPDQDTFLLKTSQGIEEYELALEAKIRLNGRKVSLEALRPIHNNSFQQAKLVINEQGKVEAVFSFYQAISIEVVEITKNSVTVKKLNSNEKKEYNIDDEVDLIRNNYAASLSSIKEGDQGLVILGINNQLQKLVLYHYETSSY